MSTAAAGFRRTDVKVNVPAMIEKIISALEDRQPQTKGELAKDCEALEIEINVALDRALTDDRLIRRIIDGRIVYHLPEWIPPVPVKRKPEAVEPEPVGRLKRESVEPTAPVKAILPPPGTLQHRLIAELLLLCRNGASQRELAKAAGASPHSTTIALKELRQRGALDNSGNTAATRWWLTDAARKAIAESRSFPQPNLAAALSKPPVQPIETVTSTAAPAASATSRAVTEPPGPREGLSHSSSGDLYWQGLLDRDHEPPSGGDQSRQALINRYADFPEPAQPTPLTAPGFVLTEASSNTGEAEGDIATSTLIDEASFALWSDGRLEIDAGDQHITLTKAMTRALVEYLDNTCELVRA